MADAVLPDPLDEVITKIETYTDELVNRFYSSWPNDPIFNNVYIVQAERLHLNFRDMVSMVFFYVDGNNTCSG